MIKKVLEIGLLSILFSTILLLPVVRMEGADDRGFINLNEARYSHPLGGELGFLERKHSDYQKTLQNLYQQQSFFADLLAKHDQQVEKRVNEAREDIEKEFLEKRKEIDRQIKAKYGKMEEEIGEQFRGKIAEFEQELQKEYQGEIVENLGRFNQEYRDFREKLRDQYSFEIFNLKLQLQMARLSDEEREKKEAELEELEKKRDEALRQMEMEISWGMRTIAANLQMEMESKLASFVSQQEDIIGKEISFLEDERERERINLYEELEKEKKATIEAREKEIREKAHKEISGGSSNFHDNIKEQLENLNEKKKILQERISFLKGKIDNDLWEIAQRLSIEKGIMIELVDVLENEKGIDFTRKVKEMLE